MSTLAAVCVFVVIFLLIPAGRRIFLIFLGMFYIPLQFLFMWLQKVNFSLKDGDPLVYYLSSIVIYPLFAVIIILSKMYESFTELLH